MENSISPGGIQWRRDYGSPSPYRRTLEQVPYAPPAPPLHLPLIAEEKGSTAREGAIGEGASSQGGESMEDLDSEFDLDMREVWPPVRPARCEAPAAEPGVGAEGVQEATLRHHRSPPGGPTSVAATAAIAATVVAPEVITAAATTAGTFPHLWGDLRGTWRFLVSFTRWKANA